MQKELSEADRKLLDKLEDWLGEAESSVGETLFRKTELLDLGFYALCQDSKEVVDELQRLNRPALVYDEIRAKIDAVIAQGLQITEAPAMKHVGQEDQAVAELGRNALAHFRRRLGVVETEHDCWTALCKSGLAYQHFYVDASNPFKPQLKTEMVLGRDCFRDPLSRDYEMRDARYFFREKWVDEDVFDAVYGEIVDKATVQSSGQSEKPLYFSEIRNQYRLIECWYREFAPVIYFINPQTQQDEWVKKADWPNLKKAFEEEFQVTLEGFAGRKQIVKYALFTAGTIIEKGDSPYTFSRKFELFPYIPYGAYKDDLNNRYFGPISPMRDPQTMLNTMMRQLTHLLQTAPRGILMHEVGAVLNIEEYEKRGADPTYHMEVAKGQLNAIKFSNQPQISPVYESLIAKNKQSIKDSSGVQDPMLGIQTSSREPGVTAGMRQDASLAVLAPLFYNYARSRRMATRILFAMMQQYITTETLIRIEGPEGEQLLQMNTQMNPQNEGFNAITTLEYDIEIDYTAETKTNKDFTLKLLSEYGMNNPGAVPTELLLEYTSLPMAVKQKMMAYQEQQRAAAQAAQEQQAQLEQQKLALEKERNDRDFMLRMMELQLDAQAKGVQLQMDMMQLAQQREERREQTEEKEAGDASRTSGAS